MIQKRYKQTEKLAQAQGLKQMLENLPVILAEIPLPEIEKMPSFNQILRVQDINVAVCSNFVGLRPKRILIDKETKEEFDMNLFVPKWEITGSNFSSFVNANGEREFFEMEWFNTETGEIATTEMTQIGWDNEGQPIMEEQLLEDLDPETFLIPSIPYLMFFTQQVKLPALVAMFSQQFINDNAAVWTRLKEPS